MRSLADELKAARKAAGFTQESLAKDCGCSRSSIAAYEGGTTPTADAMKNILKALPDEQADRLRILPEVKRIVSAPNVEPNSGLLADGVSEDMIQKLMSMRRTTEVDIAGKWNAMWLTTRDGAENRNREVIDIRRRWNGSWQLKNEAISDDNPDGGYLWIARLELFDNKHLLGHYCATERTVLAKGVLHLELQTDGREIIGVWDGINFDTTWASGMVALCSQVPNARDPEVALNAFIGSRPKMPY